MLCCFCQLVFSNSFIEFDLKLSVRLQTYPFFSVQFKWSVTSSWSANFFRLSISEPKGQNKTKFLKRDECRERKICWMIEGRPFLHSAVSPEIEMITLRNLVNSNQVVWPSQIRKDRWFKFSRPYTLYFSCLAWKVATARTVHISKALFYSASLSDVTDWSLLLYALRLISLSLIKKFIYTPAQMQRQYANCSNI